MPRRIIGLAGSSIWLAVVGAIFPIVALVFVGTTAAWTALALGAALVAAIVLANAAIIRGARRAFVPFPPSEPMGRVMARRFKYVLIGEIAAFWIVNTILAIVKRYDLMVPADVLIVGIHFLPLAWVFRVPRYYALGVAFCVAVAMTMWLVPSTVRFGVVSGWFVWISAGAGASSILCAVANTVEARHALAAR